MSTKSFRSNNNRQDLESFINTGSNKIKRKIRDIERLLAKKKDSLPDTILIEKERYLKTLHLELKHNELKQKAQKYSKKYHMIRFFEKKKAMKNYKKAIKQNKEDTKKEQLELLYAYNFPKCEKYVALYPSTEEKESAPPKDRLFYLNAIEGHWKNKTLPLSISDIMNGKKTGRDELGLLIKENIPEDLQDDNKPAAQNVEKSQDNENSDEDDFFE